MHDCGRMPGEWFYSHFIYGSNYRFERMAGGRTERATWATGRADQTCAIEMGGCWTASERGSPASRRKSWTNAAPATGSMPTSSTWTRKKFAGIATERFIAAMNAEGIPNQASYPPLHQLHMFPQWRVSQEAERKAGERETWVPEARFPVTQKAAWETVWIPQPALLGDEEDMHEIAAGLAKIQKNAKELA